MTADVKDIISIRTGASWGDSPFVGSENLPFNDLGRRLSREEEDAMLGYGAAGV